MLGAITGYSQMIYDFKDGKLKDYKDYVAGKKRKEMNLISGKITEYAGEIYLKSGKALEGNFFVGSRPEVTIVTFPDNKKLTIKAEDIHMIKVFATGNEKAYDVFYKPYLLEESIRNYYKVNKGVKKLAKKTPQEIRFNEVGSAWMMLVEKGKANLYVSGAMLNFYMGELVPIVVSSSSVVPPFVYIGQIEGKDEVSKAVHLGGNGGDVRYFLACAPSFFEGHPISEKIRNQEEGFNYASEGNIIRIFEMYNEDYK